MRYAHRRHVSTITVFIVALAFLGIAFTFSVHAQRPATLSTTPVSLEQTPATAADTLDRAKARATEEGKLLFVHFSTPTCGWCKRLEMFLNRDAVKRIFDEYYLKVKIDQTTMKDGTALRRTLSKGLGGGGVPWFAILNDEGEVLKTATGPNGNIGYPLEPEGAAHFMTMIKRTAPKMTSEEFATIESELRQNNDAINAERNKRASGR